MIGEWVDESPTAIVITSYHWDADRRAILSEFKIQVGGRPTMTGTQRISRYPSRKNFTPGYSTPKAGLPREFGPATAISGSSK